MKENIIYHYCGVETFLNIIRNHTLRLSDLCKSTDRMELKALLEKIKEKILERYRNSGDFVSSVIYGMNMDDAFEYLTDKLITKMKDDTDQMLFGVCFSEDGDLLSQWREYADRGTGLAIGFDAKWFENLCNNELFKFSKVTYGFGEENEKIIDKYANQLYDEMLFAIERNNVRAIVAKDVWVDYLTQRLLYQDSMFIKREEYVNEMEWRLILDDEDMCKWYGDWGIYYNWKEDSGVEKRNPMEELIPNGMEFLAKNGKIIPFLDLKFDLNENDIPVKKIIIGPNCKVDELDIIHVLEFFHYDSEEIDIVESQSSYCL